MSELSKIAAECRDAAEAYQRLPGLAGPGGCADTIMDLYWTIARLADAVEKMEKLRNWNIEKGGTR